MNEKFAEAALECYQYNKTHNIAEYGVLMVTITLDEYRELVKESAKAEQIKHDKSLWQYEQEIKELKDKLYKLTIGEDEVE